MFADLITDLELVPGNALGAVSPWATSAGTLGGRGPRQRMQRAQVTGVLDLVLLSVVLLTFPHKEAKGQQPQAPVQSVKQMPSCLVFFFVISALQV